MLTDSKDGTKSLAREMGDPSNHLRGTLYLWPDGILFLGENVRSKPHSHFTASLFWVLDGGLRIQAGPEQGWLTTRGALVAPNVRQEMDARGCQVAILQIDPETDEYARVACRLTDGPVYDFPAQVLDELCESTQAMLRDPTWTPAQLSDRALGCVGGPPARRRPFDPRIQHVLDRLKGSPATRLCARRLAEAVGLSRGRLLHLFTKEIGVSLRPYVLWLRMRHAIYFWALTRSFTQAAYAAGFADSAHLSRTFGGMFGICPSHLFRHDARVRIVIGLPDGRLGGPHASHDTRLWTTAASALKVAGEPRGDDQRSCWIPIETPATR